MQTLKTFKDKPLFLLRESHSYRLIALYRCFAMIPPTVALMMTPVANFELTAFLYCLSWANALLQLAQQLLAPSVKQHSFKMPLLICLELLLCATLNGASGIWSSPYYLYSLAPIFQSAFFYGLKGAILSATMLSVSYGGALTASIALTGKGGSWLVSVTLLTGFFGSAALFGYQSFISNQLRKYATTIEQYRTNLEQQNNALEQANWRLEQLAIFSRILHEGNTHNRIEELALHHLNRLYQSTPDSKKVWLVRETFETDTEEALGEVLVVEQNGSTRWVAPLNYKAGRFGALVVEATATRHELNDKLLLALLAEQLSRALGSLKQSQALAIEAERARLAMDMHDVIAQSMFGIAFNLDACLKLYEREPEEVKTRLFDLKTTAFDMLGSVRAIIYDLWNEEIGEADFASLVETYIKKAGRLYPFKIFFKADTIGHEGIKFERETQKGLYRLIQEALSNAARHSGASEVKICLTQNTNELLLEVCDNGCGLEIPTGQAEKAKITLNGLGIPAMRERVAQLGGNLEIISTPGSGLRLIAKLPYTA